MQDLKDAVRDAINEWDPLGVFPFAPDDEYDHEIQQICAELKCSPVKDANELFGIISGVFSSALGNDFLDDKKDILYEKANRILKSQGSSDNIETAAPVFPKGGAE